MDPEKIIDVVQALDPLSELPRTGWLLRGIRPCESIADHSYGVALVAMLLTDAVRAEGTEVDGERVLRMAVLHDAAECGTGDVPMPHKKGAVAAAMHAVEEEIARRILPGGWMGDWTEAESGDSVEARIVKAADKVQMMIKALTYEQQGRGVLDEFWRNPRNFRSRRLEVAQRVFAAIAKRAGRELPSQRTAPRR